MNPGKSMRLYALESLDRPGTYLARTPRIAVLMTGGGCETLFFTDLGAAERECAAHADEHGRATCRVATFNLERVK